jgi:hypothetical protein
VLTLSGDAFAVGRRAALRWPPPSIKAITKAEFEADLTFDVAEKPELLSPIRTQHEQALLPLAPAACLDRHVCGEHAQVPQPFVQRSHLHRAGLPRLSSSRGQLPLQGSQHLCRAQQDRRNMGGRCKFCGATVCAFHPLALILFFTPPFRSLVAHAHCTSAPSLCACAWSEWLTSRAKVNGRRGFFPSSYVEEISVFDRDPRFVVPIQRVRLCLPIQ